MSFRRGSAARRVGLVLAGLLVGFALAWVLLPMFLTPEEAEGVRTVPDPESVTAAVEEGVLREVIQIEGVVLPRASLQILAPQPAGSQRPVVTFLPPAGSMVGAGEVIVGLSGRPVIYLGRHPNLSRDLHRGLSGDDVAAYQRFLVELGHLDSGDFEEGVFGGETEEAVEGLYISLGYDPAPPSVPVTEEQLLMAESNVAQAEQSLRSARQGGDRTAIDIATRSLDLARRQLQALIDGPRLSVPISETVGLPHDRVVVVGSPASEGAVVDVGSPVLEIRTEGLILRATTTRARGSGVVTGQAAVVLAAEGRVETAVEQVFPRSDDASQLEITMGWDHPGVPGERMVVEIEVASTEQAVVSVPVSAIRTDADGTSYVTVLEGGSGRRVVVELGTTLGGRTQVSGDLRAGEQVIVGRR